MRILGIDPGYAILGYGVIDMKGNRFTVCGYGAVTTDSTMDMPDRLKHLYTEIMEIIREYEPDVVSIEELFFNTNSKTAILVGQARGVAILACANSGVEIYEYTPLQIKQGLVGYGRAEKKQIQIMVKTILHLDEVPKPDDTADALAAAICHGHCAGHLDKLDKYNKQLEKYNLSAPKKRALSK
jgi:crossover junction endodeoxyribonuclease RuvC